MKKIGIDARLFSQTGVGTYLQNLLFYLDKKNPKNFLFYVYLRSAEYSKIQFKSKNIIKRIADYKWHSIAEQSGFLFLLIRDNLDLMHFTYFSYPILYWKKFIATIHDTTPLSFKTGKASTRNQFIYFIKHFVFKIVLNFQVNLSKQIITPTKTVKQELINIYGDKISFKIRSIYEGINYKLLNEKENISLKTKYKNFLIYVGNFYPHKNVERLLDAFTSIDDEIKLILIGPNDYFTDRILHYIDIKKLNNRIILIKNPPNSDLIFFYKNALAIVQPSLSEGFGLPLVEAAYFNTPIIASNIDVFQELWGNQFISFNPKNKENILLKIQLFLNKKPKFNYGSILNDYSFSKMTEKTIKIYQSVTQNS